MQNKSQKEKKKIDEAQPRTEEEQAEKEVLLTKVNCILFYLLNT